MDLSVDKTAYKVNIFTCLYLIKYETNTMIIIAGERYFIITSNTPANLKGYLPSEDISRSMFFRPHIRPARTQRKKPPSGIIIWSERKTYSSNTVSPKSLTSDSTP